MKKKEMIIGIILPFVLVFIGYLCIGFIDWIVSDPLNIINNYK